MKQVLASFIYTFPSKPTAITYLATSRSQSATTSVINFVSDNTWATGTPDTTKFRSHAGGLLFRLSNMAIFFFGFVLTYPVTAFFLINLPVTSFINNFPMNDKSFCRSSRDVMRLRNSLSVDWPNGRFIDDSVFFNSHLFQFHSFRHCAMENSLYDDAVDSDKITYQEMYWN